MNLKNKITSILKTKGPIGFVKFILLRLINTLVAIPFAFGIICLSPFIRIRFFKLFSSRIGHYSFNTEAILCGLDLNLDHDKRQKNLFYILPNEPICNTQLHLMWKRTLSFIPFSGVARETDKLLEFFGSRENVLKKTFEPGGDGRDRWGLLQKIKKCHLSFTAEEDEKGSQLLEKLGIPKESRFVCLLVRDSQYLNSYIPSGNWSYHDYRDADVNAYHLAAEFLAEKGYYVLRMGKIVKDPFHTTHPKIIDYALHPLQSDFLDIYLSAKCFFFISTCTGLDSVARMFRKPLLVTNLGLPDFDIWHPWDIFIPKKIWDTKRNKFLTFREMNQLYQEMPTKQSIMQTLKNKHLCFIENTPEEIKNVVKEMLDRLEETKTYSQEENELQSLFWKIFPKYLVSDELPSLNLPVNEKINMRIGSDFLKQNITLVKEIQQGEIA